MGATILTRRGLGVPPNGVLAEAELAVDVVARKLYVGDDNGDTQLLASADSYLSFDSTNNLNYVSVPGVGTVAEQGSSEIRFFPGGALNESPTSALARVGPINFSNRFLYLVSNPPTGSNGIVLGLGGTDVNFLFQQVGLQTRLNVYPPGSTTATTPVGFLGTIDGDMVIGQDVGAPYMRFKVVGGKRQVTIGEEPISTLFGQAKLGVVGDTNSGAPQFGFEAALSLMDPSTTAGCGGEMKFGAGNNGNGFAAIKGALTDSGGRTEGDLNFWYRASRTETFMTLSATMLSTGDWSFVKNVTVGGNITATGNITAFSDRRLKSNIATIEDPLQKVMRLRGVTFMHDGLEAPGLGVIAQEVEEVFPELVTTHDNGMKSVAYGNLVGVLIEAVKELTEQVEALKNDASN